jgi:hypothetical protein
MASKDKLDKARPIPNGDSMVIQWDLMGFNGIYDGIASGKHTNAWFIPWEFL